MGRRVVDLRSDQQSATEILNFECGDDILRLLAAAVRLEEDGLIEEGQGTQGLHWTISIEGWRIRTTPVWRSWFIHNNWLPPFP